MAATVTTTGVEGTSDQVWTFTEDVRPCRLTLLEAQACYIKVNGTDDNPASATDFDFYLATVGAAANLDQGGQINVKTVSVYAAAGTPYDKIVVRGWQV